MRRSVFFLTPLIPLALAACEDGPNQTFQPATGTLFNNGDTPAAVSDAGDPLNSSYGGSTKTQICAGDELQKEWGAMVNQPLGPVRFMAGLDMADGLNFPLLTVEKAEVGPTYPIMPACVTELPPKSASDGFWGFTSGSTPITGDPCLTQSNGSPTTQDQCKAMANNGKNCGWNVVPATSAYLQSFATPAKLCQPTVLGAGPNGSDVGGSIVSAWGNASEFTMEWAVPTHKAYVLTLNPGYIGHMTWNYLTPVPVGSTATAAVHSYDYQISYPIKKDGQIYEIDWLQGSKYPGQVDELYRGIASTFAQDIYDDAPAGVTCNNTGTCLAYANAQDGTGRALFGMRPVSFYMFFDPPTLPNPSGFTVQSAYLFNIKYAPYSGITSYFKMYDGPLDGGGIAAGGNVENAEPFGDGLVGNRTDQKTTTGQNSCHFGMNDTFKNLLDNCIDVFQVPQGCTPGAACDVNNLTAQHKVLGDLAHDDQDYTFAVVGINQNFRPVKLDVCTPELITAKTNCGTDTTDIIHDTDSPLADPTNNLSNTFTADVRSFGPIQNDYAPPGTQVLDGNAPNPPISCTAANGPAVCNPPEGTINPVTGGAVPAVCDTTSSDPFFGTCVAAAWSKDFHGSGAVWREYGRRVQKDMNAQYMALHNNNPSLFKSWHDPSCYFPEGCLDKTGQPIPTVPPAGANPGLDTSEPSTCGKAGGGWGVLPSMEMAPVTTCAVDADCTAINPSAKCNLLDTGIFGVPAKTCTVNFDVTSWRAAEGCTGFESWITAAEAAPQDRATTPGDDIWDYSFFGPDGLGGGFKPGTPQGLFCNDPAFLDNCGLSGDVQGLEGDLLGTSTTRLLQYLGGGDVLNLPFEGRDRRYFFKQWSIAYAKYLTSQSVLDHGLASGGAIYNGITYNGLQVDQGVQVENGAIATNFLDVDNFIFDSFGGGASRSEYIDFGIADQNNDPLGVEQKILILGSNLQATDYYRKMDREERAIFNTLAIDKTQASWGYLSGAVDTWPIDTQPKAATPVCATDADCSGPLVTTVIPGAPIPKCDLIPNDPNNGLCVYEYPRHNANPFLTNLAGSAILVNGDQSIPKTWANPSQPTTFANANGPANIRVPLPTTPAPINWFDPCNPVPATPQACQTDADCPGLLACSTDTAGTGTGTCVPAYTAYFCATHSKFDPNAAGCTGTWTAPLNDDGTMVRRENGKPLLEGYCSVWQPNPFSLQTNSITPTNPNGLAAGIQVVKTFPDEQAVLLSLPTYPNPYAPDPTANKAPVQVIVPWMPFQEGVGYPVATNGSQDIFVETAQLDFTGQVITPTMDFFPAPLPCQSNSDCAGGLTCQGAITEPADAGTPSSPGQCLAVGGAPSNNPAPPYGLAIQAWETQDFLGEVFLCIDPTTSANRNGLVNLNSPGDVLSAHMYSSAETIVTWLSTHPNAQNACGIIVRYSVYDNYPDYITSISGGVRLNIEQGAGFGRVVDAITFAPGTGVAATP